MVRLSDTEHDILLKTRELLIKKGYENMKCPKCGKKFIAGEIQGYPFGKVITTGNLIIHHILMECKKRK